MINGWKIKHCQSADPETLPNTLWDEVRPGAEVRGGEGGYYDCVQG